MANDKDTQNKHMSSFGIGMPESRESLEPLITTIIPTYRRPKLLRRAIKSVLNQTYPHFQVCVYDNASGDETAKVVAEFSKNDSRVKYHCHSENIGALANFNYGMKHVETPFFSFLSDDDILLPECYQTAMVEFRKHPEAIFSSTLTLYKDDQNNISDSFSLNWTPGFYQPPEGLLAILKNGHPTWTGTLYRREIVEKVSVLAQNVGMVSDLDFILKTAAHLPFVISLKPGAIFISHPESGWSKVSFGDIWPGWLKIISNLTEDEHIPLDVRIFAEQVLTRRLKNILYSILEKSILLRNDNDAYKVTEVFKNYYHQKARSFFCYITAKICKHFPPAYYFLLLLSKARKSSLLKRNKVNKKISKEYQLYILKVESEY